MRPLFLDGEFYVRMTFNIVKKYLKSFISCYSVPSACKRKIYQVSSPDLLGWQCQTGQHLFSFTLTHVKLSLNYVIQVYIK